MNSSVDIWKEDRDRSTFSTSYLYLSIYLSGPSRVFHDTSFDEKKLFVTWFPDPPADRPAVYSRKTVRALFKMSV